MNWAWNRLPFPAFCHHTTCRMHVNREKFVYHCTSPQLVLSHLPRWCRGEGREAKQTMHCCWTRVLHFKLGSVTHPWAGGAYYHSHHTVVALLLKSNLPWIFSFCCNVGTFSYSPASIHKGKQGLTECNVLNWPAVAAHGYKGQVAVSAGWNGSHAV